MIFIVFITLTNQLTYQLPSENNRVKHYLTLVIEREALNNSICIEIVQDVTRIYNI